MRANYPEKTCEQMHSELLQAIRAEFEHNLSQQLYVSVEAWHSVKNAKNYTVTLINNAAKDMENGAPAIELSRKILDMAIELDPPITEKAINELKREIQQIFWCKIQYRHEPYKKIDHRLPRYFPGAISYPGFSEEDTPIEGCYTMLNIFADKEYNAPGIHEDNEGFYVIGGTGKIMIADEEYDISQGSYAGACRCPSRH